MNPLKAEFSRAGVRRSQRDSKSEKDLMHPYWLEDVVMRKVNGF